MSRGCYAENGPVEFKLIDPYVCDNVAMVHRPCRYITGNPNRDLLKLNQLFTGSRLCNFSQFRARPPITFCAILLSYDVIHKTGSTYRKAVRGGSSHGQRQYMHKKSVKFGRGAVFELRERTDRQTD